MKTCFADKVRAVKRQKQGQLSSSTLSLYCAWYLGRGEGGGKRGVPGSTPTSLQSILWPNTDPSQSLLSKCNFCDPNSLVPFLTTNLPLFKSLLTRVFLTPKIPKICDPIPVVRTRPHPAAHPHQPIKCKYTAQRETIFWENTLVRKKNWKKKQILAFIGWNSPVVKSLSPGVFKGFLSLFYSA